MSNNRNNNRIIVFSSILGAILATGLLALNPSMVGAQQYGDHQYGYDNNKYQKKSSDVNIQKIKCVNSNININGIDITQIPTDDLATAESANEGADATGAQNSNGLDKINFERNLVNICINANANEQIDVTEPGPGSLTVNKEIFGCVTDSTARMSCQTLQDGSSSWLPCTDPLISGTVFCQNLPANLFDIEVLDDQNIQLQQFEGSAQGTTIQNLQPGTYAVNEIKHADIINQLGEDATSEAQCVNVQGFADGGTLENTNVVPFILYNICFEYEDEQGNDCSTLTLAAGENKLCTVKNYISSARVGD